jgi:hypothetical protein
MNSVSEQRFGAVESCVDYQSYVYHIDPELTPSQYSSSSQKLKTLGDADDERMGVLYVRGPWGFFVIPRYGYPTIRVSFYFDTPAQDINDVMALICAAFESSKSINN